MSCDDQENGESRPASTSDKKVNNYVWGWGLAMVALTIVVFWKSF